MAAARATAAVDSLGLFSPNEEADDIATRDLKYLLLPFYRGELAAASRVSDPEARADALLAAASYHRAFLHSVRAYGLLGSEARTLVEALEEHARGDDEGRSTSSSSSLSRLGLPGRPAGGNVDPDAASLRANKIARFKREKWVMARLEALEAERGGAECEGEGEDTEAWEGACAGHAEERERELWLLQIEQAALQAADRLKSLDQEAALLLHAAALPREQRGGGGSAADRQRAGGGAALPPAMLAKLREAAGVLAGASVTARRQELRDQVLQPSHVLPTMTGAGDGTAWRRRCLLASGAWLVR